MLTTVLGLALLAMLAVAVLPVPRVRRLLLTATARLVQAVVLAFLGACGTFFVQPQSAPGWLTAAAHPLLEGTLGLPPDMGSGLPWLLLAVLAVGVSLPVLVVIELASSLAGHTARVQGLCKEIRHAAGWLDRRLTALESNAPAYPPLPSEAAAAAAAFRSTSSSGQSAPAGPAPLVLDLLQ